jgi:hypothetical protein
MSIPFLKELADSLDLRPPPASSALLCGKRNAFTGTA